MRSKRKQKMSQRKNDDDSHMYQNAETLFAEILFSLYFSLLYTICILRSVCLYTKKSARTTTTKQIIQNSGGSKGQYNIVAS